MGSAAPSQASAAARVWPWVALLAGNAALAFGPLLVRLADTGPVSAGFWRLGLALPMIALLAWREDGPLAPPRRTLLALAAAGVFFALDLASWHIGIERTRLGNATLFGNAGSLVLMVWGFVALARWPGRREWAVMAMALAGAGLLIGQSAEIAWGNVVGDLFALAAGLLYAGYLLILQRERARLGGWTLLFWVCLTGAPLLLAIGWALGEPVWPGDWRPVATLALTSQLVGQGLLVLALRHFAPLVIGLALLTQPAIAAATGVLAFGEALGPGDLIGMALLGGALAVARRSAPPRRPR